MIMKINFKIKDNWLFSIFIALLILATIQFLFTYPALVVGLGIMIAVVGIVAGVHILINDDGPWEQ